MLLSVQNFALQSLQILYYVRKLAFLTTTFLGYFHFSQTSVNNDNNVKSNFPK